MNSRPLRKRILVRKEVKVAIMDELEFIKNKCSDKARKIVTNIHKITIDLWLDKHYHNRTQLGDDNGKRENIDLETVKELVAHSIKHLLFYSSLIKGFTFLNHEKVVGQSHRIVLQRELNESMLNVLIQAHFIEPACFEITVITAMCVDGFRLGDGQFVVEMQGDNSILKKFENKKFLEIASF